MDTAGELLRTYQAQERRFVERRFPLRFEPESPIIRELYGQAKGLSWNPETEIAWSRFDAGAYSSEVRKAARLTWSRRAWGAYPGLGESTALLLRLCLESGAHMMDAKLFLSFRPAEEAKHLEACVAFARALGGYVADPGDETVRSAANHPFTPMALDADRPVEAFVAAVGCLDDQLDLNLTLSHLHDARDPLARQILRLIAGDKQRHALFAWAFLAHRAPSLDAVARAIVAETVRDVLERAIFQGYRNTWLLPKESRELFLAAEALTAQQGLGASTVAQEKTVMRATIRQVRERLAAWEIALPLVEHPEIGEV
jgi:hypothetical protein